MKILTDLATGRHYTADGTRLTTPLELLSGGTTELEWQFYSSVSGSDPAQWTKAAFASGVTASCSAIRRFQRSLPGTTAAALAAGTALTRIEITSSNTLEEFAASGSLLFRPASGSEQTCEYTALTRSTNGVTATVNWTPTAALPQGTAVELPAAPYCAALATAASSDPATGKFQFSLQCDSTLLRRLAAAEENEFAPDCQGLEVVLYQNSNSRLIPIAAVLLKNVQIRLLSASAVTSAAPIEGSTLANWLASTVKTYAGINPASKTCNNGTVALEAATRIYTVTPTAAVTISIDASAVTPVAGTTFEIWLDLSSGTQTVTWPTGLTWLDGSAPDLSTAALYVIAYRYYGATIGWRANLADKVEAE